MLPTDAMKNFDELAEAVKARELSFDETMYVLQQVQEMTLANDKNLSKWTHLLGFMKEYRGFELNFKGYERAAEKTIEDFHLLAKYCPDLESIKLAEPEDNVLAFLNLFPKLSRLYIDGGRAMTDEGAEHIWCLSQLTHLTINSYEIYGECIQNLCRLRHLVDLTLKRCEHILDDNLEQILALEHLNSLNLGSSLIYVTDEGVSYIAVMKNLIRLGIGDTPISDEGILSLNSLSKLKQLLLYYCNITDKGLSYLTSFQNLEFIDLSHCEDITDQGLLYLNNVPKLRAINLSYCEQITKQAIEKLSPRIRVIKNELKSKDFCGYGYFLDL